MYLQYNKNKKLFSVGRNVQLTFLTLKVKKEDPLPTLN